MFLSAISNLRNKAAIVVKQKNTQHFGAYLGRKRKEAGLSQEEAAAALGYSDRFFLSRIENSRVSLPLDKIPVIAELYSIPVRDLAAAVIEEQTRILRGRVERIIDKSTSAKVKRKRRASRA